MMRKPATYPVLLLLLMMLPGCIPDEKMYEPDIFFIRPEAGFTVYMPDTLDVAVEITDDMPVRSVILGVVNENSIPVTPLQYFYPNKTSYVLESLLPLTDISLSGGNYYVMVTVSDGENSKNKYQEIIIDEIPMEIMGAVAVTRLPDRRSSLIRLDAVFETDTQSVMTDEHKFSDIHSLYGQIYMVTGQPSKLISFRADNLEPLWNITAVSPRPVITGILTDQDVLFSTANGDAGILSNDGDVILRTAPDENYSVNFMAADAKYIYVSHVSVGGDNFRLTTFYRVTGNVREQKTVAARIVSIVPLAENVVLAFLPSAGGTLILEYDPGNLTIGQSDYLPGEMVLQAEKVSAYDLFLLTESRVIEYKPAEKRFTEFAGQAFSFCRYEPLNDLVFMAKDTMVYGYDRMTGDLHAVIPFHDEVLDFRILYNK